MTPRVEQPARSPFSSIRMRWSALLVCACTLSASAQIDVRAVAARVDTHYNHLRSLSARFTETYSGMGQHRTEAGTVLLRKPGRMRWSYAGGKLFVLDGKYAISYTPGDPQAQRIPAKQMEDLRSPLRFLLGHTQLEKELDHIQSSPGPNGAVILSGTPHYEVSGGEQRLQRISVTVMPASGTITALGLEEIDGSTTQFTFSEQHENVPSTDADFKFDAPNGVVITNGLPPV